MLAVATMPAKKRKPGRPKGQVQRASIVALRGTEEYKSWLDEFAEHCRLSISGTIDLALEELAKLKGFRSPPVR